MLHIHRLPMQCPPRIGSGSCAKSNTSRLPALVILASCLLVIAALSGCASPGVQEYDPWQGCYNCPGYLPDCD